jgi:amino acid transporter
MIIQTGSIALLAFVFGDYLAQSIPLGRHASAIYAAGCIIVLTLINSLSVKQARRTQNVLSGTKLLGLFGVFFIGLFFSSPAAITATSSYSADRNLGLAMVFVLLTYGGWNEIAFASAEFRNVQRDMLRALVWGILLITIVFVVVNFAYLKGLGLAGVAKSEVVATDLARGALGEYGAKFISLLIAACTLGAASGTIFTGARTNYALGRRFAPLGFMGRWSRQTNSPMGALIAQGIVSLGLVILGAWQRRGFETLVEYMAPVFWLFFLLTGISLFVLRRKDPERVRPFRVPLYPLTPVLFCGAAAYMLWSSVAYTGLGSFIGIAVLFAGFLVLLISTTIGKRV